MPPPADRAHASTRGFYSPLAHSLFRALWIANLFSNIGTWMQAAGASWLMTLLSHSPWLVALVQTATTLPVFFFAIPAGVFADLIDRPKFILFAQCFMAVVAFSFVPSLYLGVMSPRVLLWLTFLLGVGNAINTPAWHAASTSLVTKEEVTAATGLNYLSLNIGRAVGPALAGLLLALGGPGLVFLCNALSFVGVIAVVFRWCRAPHDRQSSTGAFWPALREGFSQAWRSRGFRSLCLQSGGFFLTAVALWSFLPIIAKDTLHTGPDGFGVLMGALGTGAATAAMFFPHWLERHSAGGLVTRATIIYAICQTALGYSASFGISILILFIAGNAWFAITALYVARTHASFPPVMRSRAMALLLVLVYGGQAAGSALWGRLALKLGAVAPTMGIASAGLLVLPVYLALAGKDESWRTRPKT